ncbi:MAG TPA: preprotein translocase subunit SecE [Blastocatellia bacterium]|nr:preprotein translocase subunit SecE [Blastocatellia bacterium]
MARREEEDDDFGMPEPTPARDTSVEKPIGTPPPRAAAFGEGAEGRAVRRERNLAGPRTGFFQRTAQFVRDTRSEMRRVSWPTANEVKNTTIITLIAVIFFALYLFGIDRVWAYLIEHLRTLMGG